MHVWVIKISQKTQLVAYSFCCLGLWILLYPPGPLFFRPFILYIALVFSLPISNYYLCIFYCPNPTPPIYPFISGNATTGKKILWIGETENPPSLCFHDFLSDNYFYYFYKYYFISAVLYERMVWMTGYTKKRNKISIQNIKTGWTFNTKR